MKTRNYEFEDIKMILKTLEKLRFDKASDYKKIKKLNKVINEIWMAHCIKKRIFKLTRNNFNFKSYEREENCFFAQAQIILNIKRIVEKNLIDFEKKLAIQ